MLRTVRGALALLERDERRKWMALVPLGVLNSLTETAGAASVYGLIGLVSAPDSRRRNGSARALAAIVPVHGLRAQVIAVGMLLVGFYCFKNALLLLEAHLQYKRANLAAANIASRVVSSYLRLSYAEQLRVNSSEVLRTATVSTDVGYRSVMLALITMSSEMLIALGLLVLLLFASPVITGAVVAVLGAAVLGINTAVRRRFRCWGEDVQHLSQTSIQALQEAVGAQKELTVLGRRAYFERRFDQERSALAAVYVRIGTWSTMPRLVLELLFVVALVGVIVGVILSGSSQASLVSLLGLYAYVAFRLLPSLNRILASLNVVRSGAAAVDVIRAELDGLESDDNAATGGAEFSVVPRTQLSREVSLERVTYRYPGSHTDVLRDVDVTIVAGSRVGIVGESGAGKSTLVDVMLGLLIPASGRVLVDGQNVHDPAHQRRLQVGYVPQSAFLIDDTFASNIALGLPRGERDDDAVRRAVELAQLAGFVAELPDGLETVLGERGVRISGGQRQRVAIARALYHDPDLLVFDEATSALDSVTEAEVARAILALPRSKTLVIIAHRLSTLVTCDDIVFLRDGRVAAHGPFSTLLRSNDDFRTLAEHSFADRGGRD